MTEKVVGILGGMGPEATIDLMQRIVRLTPASDDIDHIRCIVDNNPKVPSRIKAIIEGEGEDPGPHMADMGRRLEAYGADFLVIACNTAHNYYKNVQNAVGIPIIDLIRVVTNHIDQLHSEKRKIGILASPAVKITQLYSKRFESLNLISIWPESKFQELLLNIIKSVKKGDTGRDVRKSYLRVCQHLKKQGAELVIVACTELSALKVDLPIQTVDAAQILAKEIVDVVKYKKSLSSYA